MLIDKRIFPPIDLNCQHNLIAHFQKFPDQPVLHRCKSGKSIQSDPAVSHQSGTSDFLTQQIQNFLRRDIPFSQELGKTLINGLHIL